MPRREQKEILLFCPEIEKMARRKTTKIERRSRHNSSSNNNILKKMHLLLT